MFAASAAVGFAALRLTRVVDDLEQADELVEAAVASVEDGRLAEARSQLSEAQRHLTNANNQLYGAPELQLVGWVPVVRQNLASLRESVGLASVMVNGGRRILDVSAPLESPAGRLEVSLADGTLPLDAIKDASTEIEALTVQLPPSEPPGSSSQLMPQVRRLKSDVHEEAAMRRAQLGALGRGLGLLQHLAGGDGPRRYLLAIANNAEMRGAGGMVLNYGVLEGRAGTIELTEFGRIDELEVSAPVPDDLVPGDYLARWGGFDPLLRWRNANLAGDFTVAAPVLEAMYASATGSEVDGVIQVDPSGLAALLDGVGPVTVPTLGEVRGDNVVALTLHDAYVLFPDIEARTDVLGDVAEAAFRRLVDGEIPSLRVLGTRLAESVEGGHLLAHSRDRSVQRRLASLMVDGSYPPLDGPDVVALTVQNLAGNKLDYYLDTALTLSGSLSRTDVGELEAEVVLSNTAPEGATSPAYVFGPGPTTTPLAAGVVRSLVTLYLPLGSGLDGASGAALVEPAVSGTEAGRPFASFTVDVPAGATRSVTLRLVTAPHGPGERPFVVVPAPRVRPTSLHVDIATTAGPLRGDVELNRRWAFVPGSDPAPVRAPAFR